MANHDPHEVPDVTISGALALELLDVLTWADLRTRVPEHEARHEIRKARVALDMECWASWFLQRYATGVTS